MDHKDESLEGAMGLNQDDLPQMDGSCDACEPDEAQPATQVCHTCSFAFCPVHAERHANSMRHTLMPYNSEGAEACGVEADRDSRVEGAAEDVSGDKRPAQVGGNQEVAEGGEREDASERRNAQNEGKDGAEGEAVTPEEAGKRDTVTVERLRCKEHGQEGSLYCKPDEQIICVVCAVQGEHRDHEIITLREAYVWQKSRQGQDLLGYTQQMAENVKTKWTNPEMSTEELEEYVTGQFDELRRLVRLEERRTLHLVDLKEAFLTASAAEKIAEITLETEKLQEEMDNITHQLYLLEQAEAQAIGPAAVAEVLAARPGPVQRLLHDIEARPRVPEPRANPMDPRDLEDNDSGPSMDHAP